MILQGIVSIRNGSKRVNQKDFHTGRISNVFNFSLLENKDR